MKYQMTEVNSSSHGDVDESATLRMLRDEVSLKDSQLGEMRGWREDDAMTISVLEERLRDLTFTLHQSQSELRNAQTMGSVRREGWEREVSDLKAKCAEARRQAADAGARCDAARQERNASRQGGFFKRHFKKQICRLLF